MGKACQQSCRFDAIEMGRERAHIDPAKCKECGKYYTIDPKRHEYPEETRELAIKMYYGGVSGRGVGKILKMNKSNVMNWIKKGHSQGEGADSSKADNNHRDG